MVGIHTCTSTSDGLALNLYGNCSRPREGREKAARRPREAEGFWQLVQASSSFEVFSSQVQKSSFPNETRRSSACVSSQDSALLSASAACLLAPTSSLRPSLRAAALRFCASFSNWWCVALCSARSVRVWVVLRFIGRLKVYLPWLGTVCGSCTVRVVIVVGYTYVLCVRALVLR